MLIRLFDSILALLLFTVAGCSDEIDKLALTDKEKQKIIHLQNPFIQPIIELPTKNNESPLIFGIKGCKVYKAKVIMGVIVEWHQIIEPDFYPFGHSCTRQKMTLLNNNELLIQTCTQAIGAGGGCITSGKYRTVDGIHWEREINSEWIEITD